MNAILPDTQSRPCPVCLITQPTLLFRQRFSAFEAGSLLAGYDVVCCQACGVAYADNIPPQSQFDRYYAEMSKYEYAGSAGLQTDSDFSRFRDIADVVVPHLNLNHRLLDIGCATGGLLAEFKKRGFSQLLGVDPSESCAKLTVQLHGISSRSLTIADLPQLGEKFDVCILTGVLEHIRDVDTALANIRSCLSPSGMIYVEIPDATRYDVNFSAPFQYFSMEHVNYFSPDSVSNLALRHGFSTVFVRRTVRQLSPQAVEPAICGLYRLDPCSSPKGVMVRDEETGAALGRYIRQSLDLQTKIEAKIKVLAHSEEPLAVWGVGTHTLRLLETSSLRSAQIKCFIDSNVHYQNRRLHGIPVIAPEDFKDPTIPILISSQTAEVEIYETIRQRLRWSNRVHRLYNDEQEASKPLPE